MHHPGWYPNPLNAGEIFNDEAEIERYWDAADWTRVRVRRGPEVGGGGIEYVPIDEQLAREERHGG
jgi:hypothetical protein